MTDDYIKIDINPTKDSQGKPYAKYATHTLIPASTSDTPITVSFHDPLPHRLEIARMLSVPMGIRARHLRRTFGKRNVWTGPQLDKDWFINAFNRPVVVVTHQRTGQHGTMLRQSAPIVYFDFLPAIQIGKVRAKELDPQPGSGDVVAAEI